MDIFTFASKLSLGSLLLEVKQYKTFIFIKSAFTSNLYNFICPTSDVATFDWDLAEKLIVQEREKGYYFSYYLKNNASFKEFETVLKQRGYQVVFQDKYLHTFVTKRFADLKEEFVLVDKNNLEDFVSLSAICFPGWETNEGFCRLLFKIQNNKGSTRAENYLIKKGKSFVGVCAFVYSKKHGLSYQTNIGTLPNFRGQGIQKSAIKFLCNQAFSYGAGNCYTIVEPGSISEHNYLKLGLEEAACYDIFSKPNASNA